MTASATTRRIALVLVMLLAGSCGDDDHAPEPSAAPTEIPGSPASTTSTPDPSSTSADTATPHSTATPVSTPMPEPVRECPESAEIRLRGDVDGDGRPDEVYFTRYDPGAVLHVGVCRGSGEVSEIEAGGMAEVLDVVDLDGNGRDDILAGGTTVSAAIVDVIVHVPDPGGLEVTGIVLTEGFFPREEAGALIPAFHQYGCIDLTGDDVREVVQASTWVDEGELRWERLVFSLVVGGGDPVSAEHGVFQLPVPASADDDVIFPEPSAELRTALDELAPAC